MVLLSVASCQLHSVFVTLNDLFMKGILSQSSALFQEMDAYGRYFSHQTVDPHRTIDMFESLPGMMFMHEQMRNAVTGAQAYQIYLGQWGMGSGQCPIKSGEAVTLNPRTVNHCGLSKSSWCDKCIVPALVSGVYVQLLEVILEFAHEISDLAWVKESEIFFIQLLDVPVAVPFAIYHYENGG